MGMGFDTIRSVMSYYGNESFRPVNHGMEACRLNRTEAGLKRRVDFGQESRESSRTG